ncbi:hypothetical protein KFL_000720170 [Klebsormidium nitens]|uniref:Peptidase A1 domain-containing protein n=1 Tax=Klebsormidium nitens TaxID=105231 RepID=A0A1Y1HZ56_KLENI|nr:hypothetical protein KFL_000720170 [Klebsormidium nitens]|eukprot:GAQ81148.1 hypothetical protein KFL_000720170 [Klebsormidium nitens]
MARKGILAAWQFAVLSMSLLGSALSGKISTISPVRPLVSGLKDSDLPLPYEGDTVTAVKVSLDDSRVTQPEGPDKDNIIADIQGAGPTSWSISRWNKGDLAMRIAPRHRYAQSNLGIPPGDQGFTTSDPKDFSAQAWRPHPERGVTLASVARNGVRRNREGPVMYGVVSASTDSSGYGYSMTDGTFGHEDPSLDINVGAAGSVGESSIDFGVAWFPYAQGWIGGFLAARSSASAAATWLTRESKSPSLPNNAGEVVTWWARGAYVRLPKVDPRNDGMLLTIATDSGQQNSDTNIVSVYPDKKHWVLNVREDSQVNPGVVTVLNQWVFSFLYIPFSADGLIGGWVSGTDGSLRRSAGGPAVRRLGVGQYEIDPRLGRASERDGILLLQVADKEPAVLDALMARSAFLSYNYSGDNKMFVEARRVMAHNPGADLQTDAGGVRHDVPVDRGEDFPLVDTDFYFAWVDFRNPLSPTAGSASFSGPRSNNGAGFGLGFVFGLVGTLLVGTVTWIVLKYVYHRPRGGPSLVAMSEFGRDDLDSDLLESAEEYRFQD